MENKKPYTRPVIEELGRLQDVTGGSIFDIGGLLDGLLGKGRPKPGGPGRSGSF